MADIENMYIAIPLDCYKYMWIPIDLILEEFSTQYNLHAKVKKGHISFKSRKECMAYHTAEF